jgi:predicted nucleotidyltransferase
MFYEEVFRELNRTKVRYLVVGGGAVVLHGVVRMTVDLDLFVDFKEKNLLKFAEVLTKLGYKPKIPVKISEFADVSKREKWKKEKNMLVFSFFHLKRHYDHIDVFVYEPIKFEKVYKKVEVVDVEGVKIPIISVKHLKEMKMIAGRPQDLADIKALEEVDMLRKKNEKKQR